MSRRSTLKAIGVGPGASGGTLKERLAAGGLIVAFGLTTPAVAAAQVLAQAGADMLIIDMEHGCIGIGDAQCLIGTDLGASCSCVVRLPVGASGLMKPVLDAGALGLTFPMVKTAGELATAIQSALYPPDGFRAVGPHTAPARWGVETADYIRTANASLVFNVLIETREAVEAIDEIVKVPHLNIATIGLGDLAASLGHPGEPHAPGVQSAVAHIERVVLESGVALGGVAQSNAQIREKIATGYRVLVAGFDVGLLASAASSMIDICKMR